MDDVARPLDLDVDEELLHPLQDLDIGRAAGINADPLRQAWDEHCRSRDGRTTDADLLSLCLIAFVSRTRFILFSLI